MLSFDVALSNVAMALLYLLPGYIICKWGKLKAEHLSGLSALLIYGCTPCMVLDSLLKLDPDGNYLPGMGLFFVVTFAVQGLFMLLMTLFCGKKNREDNRARMLTIASVLGNVGFFGMPIIRILIPGHPEAAAYSGVYCASMNIFAFTVGIFNLTRDKKYISLKSGIVNPAVLSFLVGLPLYLARAGVWMPDVLKNGFANIGAMTMPFCMMILGARLATMPWKEIFLNGYVYLISACKLLLFPLFSYALVCLFPLDPVFKTSVLILSATPCASVMLSLAEMHDSNQQLAADCVLLSTLMCIVTIPLLTLLV